MRPTKQSHQIAMNQCEFVQVTREEELPRLNALMRSSKEKVGDPSIYTKEYMDDFVRMLGLTPDLLAISKVITLQVDGKLAGFYSLYINSDNRLELDNFFLSPEFLYQGYGKKMLSHCLETAKSYNRDSFIVWSSLEGVKFYEKMGFVKIGEKASPANLSLVQPLFQYNF